MTAARSAFSLPLVSSIAENVELAQLGEQLGYEDVWIADTATIDVFVLAAMVGSATAALRIGTAVIPVFTRPPALLAAAAASVSQVTGPDRFILGLGSSSPAIVDDWCGIPFERPVTRVRETIEALRSMFSEPKTTFSGDTLRVKNFRLNVPSAGEIPLWIGAQRPMMAGTAGEFADGVACNFIPASSIQMFKQTVADGAARAGKTDPLPLVVRLQTIVTDDRASGLETLRASIGPYLATPTYNSFLASCGYEAEAAKIKAGWENRNRADLAAGVTDELIADLTIVGDEAECRERLEAFTDAGVDIPMIHPVVRSKDEAAAMLKALAPR
ncbi:LLM class F420-dependent oxidoreductase [Nocardia sp. 348MFTsu5.1]|uniref:LLM class F420-dependent oxidoreductase n=1 Tax=Nocardia sp. 348MFTsu5.1 TaxID=1172185 RepID=UPI00037DB29F|nr:LLM class F420-dependent oxidoreductase [Nocardia sp. 348MFTsu5.1]